MINSLAMAIISWSEGVVYFALSELYCRRSSGPIPTIKRPLCPQFTQVSTVTLLLVELLKEEAVGSLASTRYRTGGRVSLGSGHSFYHVSPLNIAHMARTSYMVVCQLVDVFRTRWESH